MSDQNPRLIADSAAAMQKLRLYVWVTILALFGLWGWVMAMVVVSC